MTRAIPTALAAHYATGCTTLAWGLRVQRRDGVVYGFTSHQRDVVIGGVTYIAGPGLDVASLVSSAGFAVDNTELQIMSDETILTRVDLLAGRWDGAAFTLFRFNWADTTHGIDVRKRGIFGVVQPAPGRYTVELRSLRQLLQQPIGRPTQPTCPYRLGDERCGVDLAPYTVTGTVTGVTSSQVWTDTARTEVDDRFAAGELTWTSGEKSGLQALVRSSTSAGVITLALPSVLPIVVGDTYSLVWGCRKRRDEDCAATFSNARRFGGEPDMPGRDLLTAPAAHTD